MTSVSEEARLQTLLHRSEKRRRFLGKNAVRIREEYPDKFVAFRDESIVETADDLLEIIDKLKAKGLPVGGESEIWLDFFPADFKGWMRSWHP